MDAGIIVILVAVALALGSAAAFFWRKRAPVSTLNAEAAVSTLAEKRQLTPHNPVAPAPAMTSTELQKTDALAILEIIEGPDAIFNGTAVGKHIEIRKKRVTIGRNARQVDIQLYSLDQPSSVSRLHCTIEFHDALNCFFITDEGSSSGTKVENRPIVPYKQHSLRNGDLIELGLIEKLGALLRFNSAFTPPERLSVEGGLEVKDTLRQSVEGLQALRASTQPVRRDIFLSYSRRDKDKMHLIRDKLSEHGFSVWSDESLEPGSSSWRRDVQLAIDGAGCVVTILSPDAKESEWVNEELGYAKIRKLRIFTVLARGDESNALPLGLTGVQWIDMRSDYESGIEELVHQSALEQLIAAVGEYLGKDSAT